MDTRVVGWGAIYFAVVFATGFLPGVFRVNYLESRLGTRWAELLEMPLMFAAIVLTSRWIVRQTKSGFPSLAYWAIGLIALTLMLAAEGALVLTMRGISISEYIASRDPVSGGVYLIALLAFAVMPWAWFVKECREA